MNHAEFHEGMKRIANGRMFSTSVEVLEHSDGDRRLKYAGYVGDLGWHDGPSGESVLAAMVAPALADVASVDPLPAPSDTGAS